MTNALFPGSFDPVTKGHMDTVVQAAKAFDHLYVVVMTNTSKQQLFTPAERADFLQAAVAEAGLTNVTVLARPAQLTVDLDRELGADVLVRGVRNSADFLYEQQIAGVNGKLAPDLPTVLFLAKPENAAVASSMVKEVARYGGRVDQFLPKKAAAALEKRLKNEDQEQE